MKAKNLQIKMKGFTLIELLVVITIIGILATIVVVNLNSARGKGQDTAIKEQMSQMRAQASLYYDDNYGYSAAGTAQTAISTGVCPGTTATNIFGNDDIVRAITALQRNAGAVPACYLTSGSATVPSQDWAVTVKLRTTAGYWCVDAVGNAVELASIAGVGAVAKCQ
jgi:prepilin-type N-terminal cleavage/methylation domain-containing protein